MQYALTDGHGKNDISCTESLFCEFFFRVIAGRQWILFDLLIWNIGSHVLEFDSLYYIPSAAQ